jgi:2,3-bisphosphoglycerate-independent phosphoglycerate mutase, archaeal form
MSERKSIVLIIMDGLGDRPSSKLNGQTPMESAYMPNFNRLSKSSLCGVMHPFHTGITCGSDTSHLSILGYDPEKYYTGRGPFEALGLGMKVNPGDIAFRANYGTRDGKIITDRRAGRITQSTSELSSSISLKVDDVDIEVASGVEHRAALVMRGKDLSDKISDSDPHHAGHAVMDPQPLSAAAEKSSRILKEYLVKSREILDNHPFNMDLRSRNLPVANELLLRGAGIVPALENFGTKYNLDPAYIIGIPMIKGLAEMIGMREIKLKGITGSTDTNYKGKIQGAIKNLNRYNFILVNIKATDVAAHDRDPLLKRYVMERIDEAIEPLAEIMDQTLVIFTGDHTTSSLSGEHTGDPVPIMFSSDSMLTNPAEKFSEQACMKTGFNIRGLDVMNYAMQITERQEKYGA